MLQENEGADQQQIWLRRFLGIGDVFEGIDLQTVFPRIGLLARTFSPVRKVFAVRFQT